MKAHWNQFNQKMECITKPFRCMYRTVCNNMDLLALASWMAFEHQVEVPSVDNIQMAAPLMERSETFSEIRPIASFNESKT
jgi:hypothetical protein